MDLKTKLKNLKRLVLKRWLEFKYRHQDPDVCCCGNDMYRGYDPGVVPIHCQASCRSLKDYVIEKELERRKC